MYGECFWLSYDMEKGTDGYWNYKGLHKECEGLVLGNVMAWGDNQVCFCFDTI